MTASDEEALWVLRAQVGDRDALEHVLRAVTPSLRRYLARMAGEADADDVLQDVLVLIYRKLTWLQRPELFRPWAFRIANREAIRHLTRRRRWFEHVDDVVEIEQVAQPRVPPDDVSIRALLASHQISPACSAVLTLHFAKEMPLADVAAVLELPIGTVKSRLAYGLAALRKRFDTGRS